MSEVRAFANDERIATGRNMKDGRFFQAFPFKKYFETETLWREYVSSKFTETLKFVETFPPVAKKNKPIIKPVKKPVFKPSSKPVNKAVYDVIYSENDKSYDKSVIIQNTLPPGRYYIGDLCFVLKDEYFDDIIDNLAGHFNINGGYCMFNYIQKGEGVFEASDGTMFAVDAANIGIAHESLCDLDGMFITDARVFDFEKPIECTFGKGLFTFKSGDWSLVIDTKEE